MLQVFVPTRGRAKRRRTIKNLHLEALHTRNVINCCVVIPECEEDQWTDYSLPVQTVPDEWRIEDIRQHILRKCPGDYHVVLDDDLTFYHKIGLKEKEKITSEEEAVALMGHISELLQTYHHGSLSTTLNHHFFDRGLRECERALCVHFYRPSSVPTDFRFMDCKEYEDMHCTLTLLERGLPNVVSYYYILSNSTNSKGGCSRYRTLATQNEYAARFQSVHPKYVKTTAPKYSKVWKGDKIGVRVQWKSAFKSSATTM